MTKSWFECAPRLVDVAMGRTPADMVICNVRWVNVHSGEIIPGTDIAIAAGRFAFVGPNADHAVGPRRSLSMARAATRCLAFATRICMSRAAW